MFIFEEDVTVDVAATMVVLPVGGCELELWSPLGVDRDDDVEDVGMVALCIV